MGNILHLTLKKKWFDLIAMGLKKHEYREMKPYWEKRLVGDDGVGKVFDVVNFRNGYRPDSPVMDVEFKGIGFTNDKFWTPKHGEKIEGAVIIITLGAVLKIENWE